MNKDFYDEKIASNYEAKRRNDRFWHWEDRTLFSLIEGLGYNKDMSVIDCPVGTGRFINKLAPISSKYTGVDISEHMLKIAKDKLPEKVANVELINENIANLEIKADVIICFRLLHLLDLNSVKEVLVKLSKISDGYIILQAFDVHDYSISAIQVLKSFLKLRFVKDWRYTYRSLRSLLSGKMFSKGGSVKVYNKHSDYTENTYWLNKQLINDILLQNNMKIINELKLKDHHHYEHENSFVSTSIMLIKIDD